MYLLNKVFKNVGTRSVLYGAHCFIIHPWFVAAAWTKLYGFPLDPRLWVAFFVHDLGYIGKPNMDGDEGELHPYRGAAIMGALFGKKWFDFTLFHSRFLAKKNGGQYSKLCVADKMAFTLTPSWLYLPMVNWTGEIDEYMNLSGSGKYTGEERVVSSQIAWYDSVVRYMDKWIQEHKDLKPDLWTQIVADGISNETIFQGEYDLKPRIEYIPRPELSSRMIDILNTVPDQFVSQTEGFTLFSKHANHTHYSINNGRLYEWRITKNGIIPEALVPCPLLADIELCSMVSLSVLMDMYL